MKTKLARTATGTDSTPKSPLIKEDFASIKASFEKNLSGKPQKLALALLKMFEVAHDHTLSVDQVKRLLEEHTSWLKVRDIITQMNEALVKKPGCYVVYDNHCLPNGGVVFHRKNLPQTFQLMWRNNENARAEQQRRLSLV